MKVLEFVTELIPLTFQWYTGVKPGLMGNAVYVMDVPAQTLLPEAVIETFTESPILTVTGKSTVFPVQFPILGVIW